MSDGKDASSATASALAVGAVLIVLIGGAIWLNRPAPTPMDSPTVTPAAMPGPATAPERSNMSSTESTITLPPVELTNPTNPVNPAASLEDVISRVLPAVVLVETADGRGSAFFIARDTLLTNVHVAGTHGSVTIVRMNGARDTASVVGSSPDFDVAVLKVSNPDPNQPVIAMGSGAGARVGSEVIAIGSALGTLQNTVTRGIVSAVRRSGDATLVQTDAAINPGNSGGPLLDRDGAAIGITTMGYRNSQGLNFAVAIEHARALLEGRTSTGTTSFPAPPATAGAADTPGISPTIASDSDRARENATRVFEQTIAQIAKQADTIDADWQHFRSSCYQSRIAATFDREWLATLDQSSGRAMRDPISAGCSPWFTTITGEAAAVRDGVLQASEAARRAGVFPGTQRDTLRKYRLQVQ